VSIVLVVAPHPDDETLGCGGALLKHRANNEDVHWLIVSDMQIEHGYSESVVDRRQEQIHNVAAAYEFSKVHNLGFPPASLDTIPKAELVQGIGQVISEISPATIYLPFRGDIHTDHAEVFDAVVSCTKWFRYPSVRKILSFETLSETELGINLDGTHFIPNYFVDITPYIERKVEIASIYKEEMGEFPFPRSPEAIRALAKVRGATCGCESAESFMLLREIQK
jgi:LmbE family N-acetylglucosaminyl deacetylase